MSFTPIRQCGVFFLLSLGCWIKALRSWDPSQDFGEDDPKVPFNSSSLASFSSEECHLCIIVPESEITERENDINGGHVWCANCDLPQVMLVQRCPRPGSSVASSAPLLHLLPAGYNWNRLRREQISSHNKYMMRNISSVRKDFGIWEMWRKRRKIQIKGIYKVFSPEFLHP